MSHLRQRLITALAFGASLTLFALSGNGIDNLTAPKPLKQRSVVWHHESTLGHLTFLGDESSNPKLIKCRLQLFETPAEMKEKAELIEELLRARQTVEEVDFKTMVDIVESCNAVNPSPVHRKSRKLASEAMPSLTSVFQPIFPGTKWCGVDDVADSYFDLGKFYEMDKCCRAHDFCPMKIKGFSKKYGTINFKPYTASHCKCDKLLRSCLKKVETSFPKEAPQARGVGQVYFNLLKVQCIQPGGNKRPGKISFIAPTSKFEL